jgi:hypothetical protein
MGSFGRGVQLDRAFRLVVAFQRRPHVGLTIPEICSELECCRRTAYRYLEAAILVLPVRRVPTRPVRYCLLREEDAA